MFSKRALQPRRISRVLLLSLAAAVAFALTVLANHITTPLVRDYTMGNLAQNERELNIVVDPFDPDIVAGGANQRAGTQRWYISTDGGRTFNNGALPNGTLTVPGTSSVLMSDPSLDFGSNGEIYYSALMHGGTGEPCTLFVSVTQDLGMNWSDPANGIVAAGTTGPNVSRTRSTSPSTVPTTTTCTSRGPRSAEPTTGKPSSLET